MAYLKRKIDLYLEDWFGSPDKKPLIVKGARQTGKTESIRRFAETHYKNIVEINFIESPKFKNILEDGYSPVDIIKNITRIEPGYEFIENETLIFFDEIQSYPDIVTSLKFFSIDGRYDVICSGSLLGINYKQIESISVGYKTDYEMKSMDFEEFLWAKGYDESIRSDLLNTMLFLAPFNESVMKTFSNLFIDYVIIGGMPEVVSRYISNDNFSGTLELQRQIVSSYKEDIRKYASGVDQTRISRVYESVPTQLAKDNKKFQVSKVASGARFHDYAGCIEWLKDAGLINLCYCLNFPELPLKGNYDDSKFKIYLSDTGLLVSMLDDESQEDLRVNKNLGVYKGALYESIVSEALYKDNYGLFYYKRDDGTLEEDFFIRDTTSLIPVEVKARSGRSQSLRSLINNDRYEDISWGVKLSSNNIGFENNIYTFPYFCTFLLRDWLKNKTS
ncbi:ATP-binding protein [Oribacterium sp. NK2B42]|uniref:ATP-binding protein n=1 Tax=Oribacterium sp. NK2B42 TaxID=689781 RepID=UPI0003F4FF60|nr:ATP-binding protein [Oribacterium sp. NK2B42]